MLPRCEDHRAFDNTSSEDLQQLITSDVDLCIPMDASPRALINTLQLIVCEPLRVPW
jgi:hypothetical protein